MAFTGYKIFPGLRTIGVVSPSVRELATTFNLEAINALQAPADEDLAWADMCGVTPAVFEGKIPLDFTALDGFEPFDGVREFKQIDVAAIEAGVNQWQRNLEWDLRFEGAQPEIKQIYNIGNFAQSMVNHARIMKARLAATVLMQGTPTTNLAQVYKGNDIPGANKSLFNTGHLANPLDPNSRTFSNYFAAAGKFSETTFATMRTNMRTVPSPTMNAETLGLQVTDVIGPSHMEEPFRQVALALLTVQSLAVPGPAYVGGAATNIYSAGLTPWRFWIAPQLDADPYVQANPGDHLWFAVSQKLPGARPVEMVGPTKEFMPRLQLFGDGSEMAAMTRKVHLLGDLDAGAAAGLPHVIARYEES
ncbi:MAG: hypothetical protein RIF41_03490 [Polyangiaceae bacterium]